VGELEALRPYVFTYGRAPLFTGFATFVVLPLLYFKIIKKLITSRKARSASVVVTWGLLWLLVYGDVWLNASEAKAMCEAEAGQRVYKTAETDGLLGTTGMGYWDDYGFSYVEFREGRYGDSQLISPIAFSKPERGRRVK